MKVKYLLPFTLALLLCAPKGYAETEARRLPPDVAHFIENRDLCEHFLGEAGDNPPEREKQVDENANRYCAGTHKKLAGLKKKYLNNKDVTDALSGYDEKLGE